MKIFDSETFLSWSLASNDVPNSKVFFGYTATLLPNSIIVYIGGDLIESLGVGSVKRNSFSDVRNIYIFFFPLNNRVKLLTILLHGFRFIRMIQ